MSSNKSLTDIICLFSSNNFKENDNKYLSFSCWHDIEKKTLKTRINLITRIQILTNQKKFQKIIALNNLEFDVLL